MNDVHDETSVRRAALRERLIEVAEATIASGGLAHIKARDLALQAGCAVGAIYQVFADIDELILHVSARTLIALEAAMPHRPRSSPTTRLLALAEAYLNYALTNRPRWDALFAHRLVSGRPAPEWFTELQARLFARVEDPIATLVPELPRHERVLLARTVFSAVHGVVLLGLDQRVAEIDGRSLRKQLHLLVTALADGLGSAPSRASGDGAPPEVIRTDRA